MLDGRAPRPGEAKRTPLLNILRLDHRMNELRNDLAPKGLAPTAGVANDDPPETGAAPPRAILIGAHAPHFLRDELLCEIFARTVAERPSACALASLDHKLTYAELDTQADAIARGLLAQGAGPGHVIGLWMARGPSLLIAQLAIAKTGAAWLPFDADAPVERIAICLKDAESRLLLTSAGFAPKAASVSPCKILVDADIAIARDDAIPTARTRGARSADPAYLIYTSGSTGTPKGIVVTQANICHYLRAANDVYGVSGEDVVFQGASAAFDLSMEEIWIPYLVGASLFVATPEMIGETEKLPDLLEQAGVTVLDTVPTLLSVLPRDVTTLRTIILGGEACPPAVAERWSRAGRKIFNSYGPTETTVVATIAEVCAGAPVTIGKPIPNYTCYIADDTGRLLARGAEGELLIGGPGVARGYLKREELTAEKFIANPFMSNPSAPDNGDPILYRSGDAALIDANGDIVFRGRIDDQIKIRGFRVELGEIESVLSQQPGVRHAAVSLRKENDLDELVAFVTTDGAAPDARAWRQGLREALPSYMVPSRFEIVDALPRLSSGKVDRKALQRIALTQAAQTDEQEEPRNETEATLLAAARRALPPGVIPFDADFFTDLGGHSLLAARFVSLLRETPRLASVTLHDLYGLRSLRALAAHLDGKATPDSAPRDLSFAPPPLLRRVLCGLAQLVALPIILAIATAQWMCVFVSYQFLSSVDATFLEEAVSLFGVFLVVSLTTVGISIGGKWLILGRTKPGRYPLWGFYYYRWWLSQRLISLAHPKLLQGSPLMRLYLMALGAKIGEDAMIGDLELPAIDLVSIGAGASLGAHLKLANARVEGNELVIGEIEIGADAYIGTSCVIEENVVIGDGAELSDLTSLPAGARVGAHEIWNGSPARHVGAVNEAELDAPARVGKTRRRAFTLVTALLALALPPLGLAPIFPAFWAFDRIENWMGLSESQHLYYLVAIPFFAWPTAFVLVIATVSFIVVFRWTILPRVTEGRRSVWSWFYLRKWAVALATEITLDTLSSFYATLYMRVWYQLMGARIGKGSEISTNLAGRYDIVEIGENCFIADEAVLGDEDIRRGWMYLKRVRLGDRVFVGNDAAVPPGADIPSDTLIGVKSKPPANEDMSEGATWFGSPPIKMPSRQRVDGVDATVTFEPPRWKRVARAVYEALNISLPTMLYITLGSWAVESFGQTLVDGDYGEFVALFILDSVLMTLAIMLVAAGVKWTTMGRYAPTMKPMWSFWAIRNETSTVLYWGMTGRVLLDYLRGTPFLPWVLRLFGARFGKGVYIDMIDITEFDCVTVGDYCALNVGSALQTHLYEDRVMKIGPVTLGQGVTIGAGSTVLYDAHIGNFARLGPLTIVMKGENIPAHSEWVGAPAQAK